MFFFSLAVFLLLLPSLYSSVMFRSTPCSLRVVFVVSGVPCIASRCCLSSTSDFFLSALADDFNALYVIDVTHQSFVPRFLLDVEIRIRNRAHISHNPECWSIQAHERCRH